MGASVRADARAAEGRAHAQPRPGHLSLHDSRVAAVDGAVELEVMASAIGRAEAGTNHLPLLDVGVPAVHPAAVQKALVHVQHAHISLGNAVHEYLSASHTWPGRRALGTEASG